MFQAGSNQQVQYPRGKTSLRETFFEGNRGECLNSDVFGCGSGVGVSQKVRFEPWVGRRFFVQIAKNNLGGEGIVRRNESGGVGRLIRRRSATVLFFWPYRGRCP